MPCSEHRFRDGFMCTDCMENRHRLQYEADIQARSYEDVNRRLEHERQRFEHDKERLKQERRRREFEARTPCPGVCGMSIAMCRCLDLPCIGGCGKLGRDCECHLNVWCDNCENQKRNCQCPAPPVQKYTFIFTPIVLVAWIAYLIFVPSSFWNAITFAPGPFFWMRVLFIGGVIALVIGSEMEANDNDWKAKLDAYQNTMHMIKESAKRRRVAQERTAVPSLFDEINQVAGQRSPPNRETPF